MEKMTPAVKREFDRINAKLAALLELQSKPKKATWIGPRKVVALTGWTATQLFRARQAGTVQYKESTGGGYLYDLNSIDEKLIIKQ